MKEENLEGSSWLLTIQADVTLWLHTDSICNFNSKDQNARNTQSYHLQVKDSAYGVGTSVMDYSEAMVFQEGGSAYQKRREPRGSTVWNWIGDRGRE